MKAIIVTIEEEFQKARTLGAKDKRPRKKHGKKRFSTGRYHPDVSEEQKERLRSYKWPEDSISRLAERRRSKSRIHQVFKELSEKHPSLGLKFGSALAAEREHGKGAGVKYLRLRQKGNDHSGAIKKLGK